MNLQERYRVVVFVPSKHLEEVLEAICDSRLTNYGNYEGVLWYSSTGVEQYTPANGADPTVGEIGKQERLDSIRVEFSIEKNDEKLETLIDDFILPAHPWEEPVIYVNSVMENIIKKEKTK